MPPERPSCHRRIACAIASLLGASAAGGAQAAGGHFDVDDATVLDRGHCQNETWLGRSPSESLSFLHVDGACRVGPFELGVNVDRYTDAGSGLTTVGPQVKWVMDPWIARLSAGLLWAVSFDVSANHLAPSHTVYVPVTLFSGERVQLHANAGADWRAGEPVDRRWGYAAEWAPSDRWSLIAERSQITQVQASRLGLRWNVDARLSVDASVAHRSSTHSPSCVLGFNVDVGPR